MAVVREWKKRSIDGLFFRIFILDIQESFRRSFFLFNPFLKFFSFNPNNRPRRSKNREREEELMRRFFHFAKS